MAMLQPKEQDINLELLTHFEEIKQVIAGVRTIRLEKNIPYKEALELHVTGEHEERYNSVIIKMCNLSLVTTKAEKESDAAGFIVGATEYSVPLAGKIDAEAELQKLESELKYTEGFLASVNKKLNNERFVQNAKPEIVENERKKKADAESKIAALKESIAALKQ